MGSSQQLSKPSAKPCHNWPSPRHSLTMTDHDWPDNAVGDWMMLCLSIKQIINWELDGNSRISHLYTLENTFHALFLNVCSLQFRVLLNPSYRLSSILPRYATENSALQRHQQRRGTSLYRCIPACAARTRSLEVGGGGHSMGWTSNVYHQQTKNMAMGNPPFIENI